MNTINNATFQIENYDGHEVVKQMLKILTRESWILESMLRIPDLRYSIQVP